MVASSNWGFGSFQLRPKKGGRLNNKPPPPPIKTQTTTSEWPINQNTSPSNRQANKRPHWMSWNQFLTQLKMQISWNVSRSELRFSATEKKKSFPSSGMWSVLLCDPHLPATGCVNTNIQWHQHYVWNLTSLSRPSSQILFPGCPAQFLTLEIYSLCLFLDTRLDLTGLSGSRVSTYKTRHIEATGDSGATDINKSGSSQDPPTLVWVSSSLNEFFTRQAN